MKSVLGKLIEREFGRSRYYIYREKLQKRESMDIFFDIYESLRRQSPDALNESMKGLLESVQSSIRISRNFAGITIAILAAALVLLCLGLSQGVLFGSLAVLGCGYAYKLAEYIRNRYCDRDVKIVLIYKIALFHLMEESCLQKKERKVY